MEIAADPYTQSATDVWRQSTQSSASVRSSSKQRGSSSIHAPISPASTVNSDAGGSRSSSIASSSSKHSSTQALVSRPLSSRAKSSLDALRRIVEIRIHHTVKQEKGVAFVMEIVVSGKDARLRILHAARMFSEFKKLQNAVCHWSERTHSNEAACVYCFQFHSPFARQIWPGPVAHRLLRTAKMQHILCARINDYVRQARGDHCERTACCDGFSHIVSVVAGFVLKDTDMATL